MKLKTDMFNNKKYDIIDDVLIKVKSTKNLHAKKSTFSMMEGKFRLYASYKSKKIESVTLFLPEYVSQMYAFEPFVEENNIEYVKVILTSNELKHPINIKNKNLELFDNGFELKNDYMKIHPAYFFDRVVGFFFSFEN